MTAFLNNAAGQWGLRLFGLIRAVLREMRDGRLGLYAASLVYTTLLSLAPLLAVCFSVLKGFGVHNMLEPFLRGFFAPLGAQGEDIVTRIVGFVDNIKVGVLGAVGIGFLLYGVIALMTKIESAFNDIWRVRHRRPFIYRVRDYLGVLLVGPLFLFLSVAMTASLQHVALLQSVIGVDLAGFASDSLVRLLPYILFALAFTMLYIVMPNTRVRILPALAAGLVTAVLWKVLGNLFGAFIAGSASTAAIYSAFAGLVIFMLWLYAGWFTVLAGGVLSYYLQNPSNQSVIWQARNLSLRVREKLAMLICAEVGRLFYRPAQPIDMPELAKRLGVPLMAVEDVTDDLVASGVLMRGGRSGRFLVPGRPFDEATVGGMLKDLRAINETGTVSFIALPSFEVVDEAVRLSDTAVQQALQGMTLKQLFLGSSKT